MKEKGLLTPSWPLEPIAAKTGRKGQSCRIFSDWPTSLTSQSSVQTSKQELSMQMMASLSVHSFASCNQLYNHALSKNKVVNSYRIISIYLSVH